MKYYNGKQQNVIIGLVTMNHPKQQKTYNITFKFQNNI